MHRLTLRVYYEDTDLAGIVYYANYLKFIERARTEMLRDIGIDQMDLRATSGMVFAVRRVEADYLAPAVMDDALEVQTCLSDQSGARIVLTQNIARGDVILFRSVVTLVALNDGRPARIPALVAQALAGIG